jgi:hypothetical protein
MKLLIVFLVLVALLVDQRKSGNPLDNLPANIEVLSHFGERADISPDNQRVAFMAKSFGDAMVIDLKARIIQCLTCNVPGATFLRVMHLVTCDYILIGPDHFENIHVSRTRHNELWFLSKERGSKPREARAEAERRRCHLQKESQDCFFANVGPGARPCARGIAAHRG